MSRRRRTARSKRARTAGGPRAAAADAPTAIPGAPSAAAANALDWPTIRGRLLAALDDSERALFCERIGLGTPQRSTREHAHATARSIEVVLAQEARIRQQLLARTPTLMRRLFNEAQMGLAAEQGVLCADRLPADTALHTMAVGAADPGLPLRLLAFTHPETYHDHGTCLSDLPVTSRLHFLRELRTLTAPHLLPRPLAEIEQHLRRLVDPVPRGLVVHLLAERLRLTTRRDATRGDLVLPQPTSVPARLAELLRETSRPTQLVDLVFAYRERFHAADRRRLQTHLRRDPAFVEIAPDLFSLRTWHGDELTAARPRAEAVIRMVLERGGRHAVRDLLADLDGRTQGFVLDLVRRDARIRYLGRGEVCPAGLTRSQVVDQLLQSFRRAQGEVVHSMFLANQPEANRRLVERLLRLNRLFVFPAVDRIDLLSNYPFRDERLAQLVPLVDDHLRAHGGHAPLASVVAEVNRSELGGDWLHPQLLADVLRRHGRFEVLPGDFVARAGTELEERLLRRARAALRAAGTMLTVQEILAERPELAEFRTTLTQLLPKDPLVRTQDGMHFQIA